MIGQLNKNNLKVLTLGAALAIQKNFALNEAFIDNITATFGAQVFVEDFSGNASSSTTQIDNWVSDETHTDIVPLFNGSMPANTGASLLNALYFKAGWKTPFSVTEKSNFLRATSIFNYLTFSTGQLVEIPYSTPSSLSLYLFLPPVTFNGSAPISSLITSTKLEAAIASMKPETVDLTFPQFNTTSNLLNAETVLSKLGIVDAFTGSADFFAVNGDYNLRLSEMIDSKVVFKLSQLGTEVSAASGLILSPPEKKKKENKTVEFLEDYFLDDEELFLQNFDSTATNFTADRPFLFLVRDTMTGLTLFSGVVKEFK